jgi:hypothetical protein
MPPADSWRLRTQVEGRTWIWQGDWTCPAKVRIDPQEDSACLERRGGTKFMIDLGSSTFSNLSCREGVAATTEQRSPFRHPQPEVSPKPVLVAGLEIRSL